MELKQYRKVKGTKTSNNEDITGYYYQGVNGTHHIISVTDKLVDSIVLESSIRLLFAVSDEGEEIYVGDKMWFEEYNHEDDDDFSDDFVRRGIKQGYRHECIVVYDGVEPYTDRISEYVTENDFVIGFGSNHFSGNKSQRPQVKFGKL